MTREEIALGLLNGRTLIQEEWATAEEIAAVDDLILEGIATATPWKYHDGYQCRRRIIKPCYSPTL